MHFYCFCIDRATLQASSCFLSFFVKLHVSGWHHGLHRCKSFSYSSINLFCFYLSSEHLRPSARVVFGLIAALLKHPFFDLLLFLGGIALLLLRGRPQLYHRAQSGIDILPLLTTRTWVRSYASIISNSYLITTTFRRRSRIKLPFWFLDSCSTRQYSQTPLRIACHKNSN